MKAQVNQTVASIVTQYPSAIPLFEGLKIDYCCGGQKPLSEACAKVGASLESVLKSLETIPEPIGESGRINWSERSISELIAFLFEKHHKYTRSQLALLEKLSEKVARVHGQNHAELLEVRKIYQQMAAELEHHLMKEEQVAFPYLLAIEKSASGTGTTIFPFEAFQGGPQRVLMMDHETVGEQLREVRRLTRDLTPPEDACVTYRAFFQAFLELEEDLHRHIHLENNVLFPMAEKLAGVAAVS